MEKLRLSRVVIWSGWPGLLLVLGFGASGFTSAFMVGCSASPVVGAILPAVISAISAIAVAFFQSQQKTDDEVAVRKNRQRQIGWIGGLMLAFFLSFFLGLYSGIQARTTDWAVGRRLLHGDIRKQVIQSDIAQALYRLDLYHALQSQGLSDRDAASFVKKHFSPNYVLVPSEWIFGSNKQPSSPEPEKPQPQPAITPKPDPYVAWPEVKNHKSPTPHSLEGIH
jgi:hypothetical protein